MKRIVWLFAFGIICCAAGPSVVTGEKGWIPFSDEKSLMAQVKRISCDESPEFLAEKSADLLEESKRLNNAWEKEYFQRVAELQDANTRFYRFTALNTQIEQLRKLKQQLTQNMESVKEIYKNRLKAVPTSFLVFASLHCDIEKESRKDIERRLETLTRRYLLEEFTPVFLTSQTTIRNSAVVRDIISASISGRCESFESDPLSQMTQDEDIFFLQCYRLYPEFVEAGNTGRHSVSEPFPEAFAAAVIKDPGDGGVLSWFGDRAKKMFNDVDAFNKKQIIQLNEINCDYDSTMETIRTKKQAIERELHKAEVELRNSFQGTTRIALEREVNILAQKLNNHVREREMIVVTAQSELMQSGQNLNQLYREITKQACEDLISRARQLKSYKFFVVDNGVLKNQEAESFYSEPIVTAFTIPAKTKSFVKGSGGIFRAGLLLGLKVKFEKEAYGGSNDARVLENSLGMKFVLIPAGTFMMGSTLSAAEVVKRYGGKEEYYKDEHTRHRVTLTQPFYLQTTEVTVGQWRSFIRDTGYRTEAETGGGAYVWTGEKWEKKAGTYWDNPGFSQSDDHPVTCVSWNDVKRFITWLNEKEGKDRYRLPTEAEWEYACRGGTETPFYTGRCISTDEANYDGRYPGNSCQEGVFRESTIKVSSFKPNTWGLYDMHGNVWEWCEDWYGDYPRDPSIDPMGPSSGSYRVLRGGSWYNGARILRAANRNWISPDGRNNGIGFRVVRAR